MFEILRTLKQANNITGYQRVESNNSYEDSLNRIGEMALIIPASELILVEHKPITFDVKVTKTEL